MLYHPDAQLFKHHPSGRRELFVRTFPCVEKLQTTPACIRPDDSASLPDVVQCLISYGISFLKHRYGKTATTVQTMCVPVQTRSFIRQVVHSKSKRLDVSLHGPDAQASYMKIACIRSTIRTTDVMVCTRQALI
jgi:hypothetical protein